MVKQQKGGTHEKPFMVESPLVIMFENPETKNLECHLHPAKGYGYAEYGLIVCDLVRNVADAFGVPEDKVWDWVDRERNRPTSPVTHPLNYGKPWKSKN